MVETILQILGAIGVIITPISIAWINAKSKTRSDELKVQTAINDSEQLKKIQELNEAQDKKLETKLNLIIERQQELESSFFDLKEIVKTHLGESDNKEFVEEGLKAATEGEALNLVKSNFEIGINRKSMVIRWGALMHRLAVDYFKNEVRKKSELRRSEILAEKRDLTISEFNSFINQKMPGIRKHGHKDCRFSDFIENLRVYASFDVLIMALTKNNLSDKEYISHFELQVNTFCRALIIAQSEWKDLGESYKKQEVA
jgi:hypothetical protein